ncbi:MAG TPA: BamA/TamA family outer membrane protein [Turneriella sp.]|nr:BamA/TamA family outer membrane protein [Turneriella sp.]
MITDSTRRYRRKIFCVILTAWSATQPLLSQSQPAPAEPEKKEATWGMFPLVLPLYTPETRLMVAGGGIFWYNPWPGAPRKRVSELMTFFKASQNQQYGLGIIAEAYFLQHRLKIMQNLDAYQQPYVAWGVGALTPTAQEEKFEARGFANRTSAMWLIAEDLYFGVMWQSQFDRIASENPSGYLQTVQPFGYDGTRANGPGLHLLLDTRDNAFSPERGQWFEARIFHSNETFAAKGNFTQTTVDYRYFRRLWFGHVLAFNAYLTTTFGDVGWYAMPRLGGQFQMRGFFQGRYLDRHLWTTQVDYRLPVWWRFGLVLFTGVGDVTDDLARPLSDRLKISYGSGLRILIDKEQQINMRLDMGFTNQGDANFYFTFKEAF